MKNLDNIGSALNIVVEMHDTDVIAIRRDSDKLMLDLNGTVYRSHGMPFVDPGTTWRQNSTLTLVNPRWLDPEPAKWEQIYFGDIIIGDHIVRDFITSPFDSVTPAMLDLILRNSDRVRIVTDRILLVVTGDGEFIEQYEPTGQSFR